MVVVAGVRGGRDARGVVWWGGVGWDVRLRVSGCVCERARGVYSIPQHSRTGRAPPPSTPLSYLLTMQHHALSTRRHAMCTAMRGTAAHIGIAPSESPPCFSYLYTKAPKMRDALAWHRYSWDCRPVGDVSDGLWRASAWSGPRGRAVRGAPVRV